MKTAPRTSPIRQTGSLLALVVLSLVALFSLSRCKYGPDKVTGVDRAKPSPASSCINQCAEQYEDSLDAESKLHKANLRACEGGDDGDDDGGIKAGANIGANGGAGSGGGDDDGDPACITAENARHKAAVQRIKNGRQDCINSCHHQGGGSGH